MKQRPLMRMIHLAHQEWAHYMRKIALEVGVPDSYRMILMFLSRHPGASQKDLAEYTEKTYAAISQTIKEMSRTGYLTKSVDSRDQRFAKLFLTEKGMDCADRMNGKIREADKIITSVVTPEKEKEMVELMALICDTIQKEL